MATVNKPTAGDQDLTTFQTVLQQQEGIFGPLVAISSEGPNNVMTFEVGTSPDPAHRATLVTYTDHPPQKDGCVLISVGTCLVSGSAQQVAAYRKVP